MPLQCEVHGGSAAVGLCAVCAMPLCRDCLRDGSYCSTEHRDFAAVHALIASHEQWGEIEALRANLAVAGIPGTMFALHDHTAAGLSDASGDVRLFVAVQDASRAAALLQSINLLEPAAPTTMIQPENNA